MLNPGRVLLRLPNWVGDAAMSTAVVRAFLAQRPDIHLEIIGRGVTTDVHHGLLPAERCHRLTAEVRAQLRGRYDLGVLLPESFSSAWYFFRAGIPSLGRRGDARDLFLRHPRPRRRLPAKRHLVEEWDEILEPLGVRSSLCEARVEFLPGELAAGAARVAAIAGGRPAVALCPGATFGPAKRWPLENFLELARRLTAAGFACIASGGPGDAELVEAVSRAAGTAPLAGLAVREWAASLAAFPLVVANDSGASHMGAACGSRVLALFGSTDPTWSRPRGPGHRVLALGLHCSPCFERECPLKHLDCLRRITVDDVERNAREMLEESGVRP